MRRNTFALTVVSLAMLAAPALALAQGPTDSATEAAEESVDAKDVVERFLNRTPSGTRDFGKAEWFRVPVVSSSPGTGVLLGGGAEVSFFRGDPSTTFASTIVASAAGSFAGQLVAGMRFTLNGADNRWLVIGDNRLERSSQRSYGLGTSSQPSAEFTAGYTYPRLNDVVYRRAFRNVYAGVGVHVSSHTGIGAVAGTPGSWNESALVAYSREHGFDPRSQGAAGASLDVRFDDRDSSVRATRGTLASASYQTYMKGFLGGDSNWQKLSLDVRHYRSLDANGRHVLAAWGYADLVTSGTAPYFDLPANGTDMQGRSARGYAPGRFRGERLAYAELEYRGTLTPNGLLGWVAFVNATTVGSRGSGERLFQSVAPAAGVGLRLLADKFSRTSICLDVAVGRHGSHGVYLMLQETF